MEKNIIIIIAIGAIIIFIFRNKIKNLLGIETEAEAATRRAKEAAKAEAATRRVVDAARTEAVETRRAVDAAREAAREAAKAEAAKARRVKEAAKAEARRTRDAAAAEAAARRARDTATEAMHPREARLLRILANLKTARMSEYDRERAKRRLKKQLEYRRKRVARGLNWYSAEEGRRRIGIPTPVTPERARAAAEVAKRARAAADREGRGRVGRVIPAAHKATFERRRALREATRRVRDARWRARDKKIVKRK